MDIRISNNFYDFISDAYFLILMLMDLFFAREEHELLEAVQARLAVHPLTSPVLGNDHREFRGRGPKVCENGCVIFFFRNNICSRNCLIVICPCYTRIDQN